MGQVRCIYYPARKNRRHFTAKDVARISKYAVRDGASVAEIMAGVAVALGVGFMICKAATSVRSALTLTGFMKKAFAGLAVGQFISLLIQTLINAQLVVPRQVKIILGICISALWALNKITDVIETMLGDREMMMTITKTLDEWCLKVKELEGNAVDYVCEATEPACEAARDLADDAIFALKSDVDKAWYLLVDQSFWEKFTNIFD